MAISNGYCSLTQIKAALRITDTVDDTLLEMAVESASRLIDGHTGRVFFNAGTAIRYYTAQDDFVVQVDDLAGTAGLVIQTAENADGNFNTTWTTTDYQLEPVNQVLDGLSWVYTRIRAVGDYFWPTSGGEALVKITSHQWGWPAVPTPVTQACVIQGSRIFKRLDSPLGVAGVGDLGVMRVSRDLDPDVAALVAQYRRTQVYA
jgi:hypothetical protein